MLSENDQRRLVMLFCFRCNSDVTLQDEEVAFQLRISNEEWQVTKAVFINKGFIDSDNSVLNWDKRQFVSDSSAARVRKHRQDKKQSSNVTVTPPDTDSDTDTKKVKPLVRNTSAPASASRFEEFWNKWPRSIRKVGKQPCAKKWKDKRLDQIADQIIGHVESMKKTKQWLDGFEPAPLTYINQGRWADEVIEGSVEGSFNTRPWYLSASGIAAKGKELELAQGRDELFPAYKVRIYHAAGVTPEDVRKAKIDFPA